MELSGKQITVIGMAKSGLAAAEFLAMRGAKVLVSDAKAKEKLANEIDFLSSKNIEVETGGNSDKAVLETDLIIVSPGVPLDIAPLAKARLAGKKIIGEIELASLFLKGKIVGITGSNGKTTTTSLTGQVLKDAGFYTQVGGNIGTPLISLADSSCDDGVTVVELSSFQLEAIETLHLKVAAILNITPNHLDRYATFEDYAEAKRRIFLNQQENDFAVLNFEDRLVSLMADSTPAEKFFFSTKQELPVGIFLRENQIIYRNKQGSESTLISTEEVKLRGAHNLENIMVALSIGIALNASQSAMRKSVSEFQGIEHRLEPVTKINEVEFVNDSKATSVDAAIKAVEAFPGNLILILGGKDKGSDYSPLRPLIAERVKHLILIGAASDKIEASLSGICPIHRATTMGNAVEIGFNIASKGDTVLLAPACSSYDMFDNFEQRGQVFKEEVLNLQKSIK